MPRSTPLIFGILILLFMGLSRLSARWLIRYSYRQMGVRKPVLVYGSDAIGNKIAAVLSDSAEFSLIGFIDDDNAVQGNYMRGRRIWGPQDIDKILQRYGAVRIILSTYNLNTETKRSIFEKISRPNVKIQLIPSLDDLLAGRQLANIARDLRIEDLLGRSPVEPIGSIFNAELSDSTVLVTGGGGSIGLELCRQIVSAMPTRLIILERNELALYRAELELSTFMSNTKSKISVEYTLGDACNRKLVRNLLSEFKPHYVFHTAAYKHVPIVEKNILESVRNNVLATEILASESLRADVERFALISTDKAVRPTNVMGATKRVAELIIQAYASLHSKTVFAIVRFGNVLGSSGSVLPLFKKQIAEGGPVTVTSKEVTRYFMTISEAVELVVQSTFLADGGEVFVLDMGNPMRIDDLAKLAIQLSGFTVRNTSNPNGEISIEYIGLRPGEKLYEELTLSDLVEETTHPKISKANEQSVKKEVLDRHLEEFKLAVDEGDTEHTLQILEYLVDGFKRKQDL